jgi:hypothetical protein
MNAQATDTLYYLVVDVRPDQPILVFLGNDPTADGQDGPHGEPVLLELISPLERFGRPGRPTFGRPVLGQARNSSKCYREFASSEDLWEAGFLPVPRYRVCDDWIDYHSPWTATTEAAYTTSAALDDSV